MKLFRFEQHRAGIVGRAMMPKGAFAGLTDDRDLGSEITRQLLIMPWWSSIAVRAALWMIWYAPLWRLGRLKTFGSLSIDAQHECLETLSHANRYEIREAVKLFKLSTTMAAIGDEKVLAHIGAYDIPRLPVTLKRGVS